MILFVDDEHSRVENYIDELENAGYEVTFCRDVDEALRFLNENLAATQLLVLDVMMAAGASFANEDTRDGLDTGVYLVKKVRQLNPDVPIIILTNRQDGMLAAALDQQSRLTILSKRDNLSDTFPDTVRQVLAAEK